MDYRPGFGELANTPSGIHLQQANRKQMRARNMFKTKGYVLKEPTVTPLTIETYVDPFNPTYNEHCISDIDMMWLVNRTPNTQNSLNTEIDTIKEDIRTLEQLKQASVREEGYDDASYYKIVIELVRSLQNKINVSQGRMNSASEIHALQHEIDSVLQDAGVRARSPAIYVAAGDASTVPTVAPYVCRPRRRDRGQLSHGGGVGRHEGNSSPYPIHPLQIRIG